MHNYYANFICTLYMTSYGSNLNDQSSHKPFTPSNYIITCSGMSSSGISRRIGIVNETGVVKFREMYMIDL